MAKNTIPCSEENCQNLVWARGLCNTHYKRAREKGAWPSNVSSRGPCSMENCSRPALARGLCVNHYQSEKRKGFEPLAPVRCINRNCDSLAVKNRRCAIHHEKFILNAERRNPDIWLFVDKSGGPDACWPWTGHRHPKQNYGMKVVNGKRVFAHRLLWEEFNGSIPEGLIIRHKCDNPPCVNPNHLDIGTYKDNAHDRDSRGRHVALRGADNGGATQTDESVIAIIKMKKAGGTYKDISAKFGVCIATVYNIVSGKSWRHIDRSLITVDS